MAGNETQPAPSAMASTYLDLGSDTTMSLEGNNLIVRDPTLQKPSTSAPMFPHVGLYTLPGEKGKRVCPLHWVLWAGLEGDWIVIHYSKPLVGFNRDMRKIRFLAKMYGHRIAQMHIDSFCAEMLKRAYRGIKRQRRALVLLNPCAGKGYAISKWNWDIAYFFQIARWELEIVELTRGGQAAELVHDLDLDKFDTVIAGSGDGTVHEIFNGLASRDDAKIALSKIAVGHIPFGSGNAMACNLYGSHVATNAAFCIIKGKKTSVDLVSITQGDRRFVSFLSQAAGLVAECDLGTEHLRWMGSARFSWGVFTRVFKRKCFPCDIAIKVVAGEQGGQAGKDAVRARYRSIVKRQRLGYGCANEEEGDGMTEPSPTPEPPASLEVDTSPDPGLPSLKYGTVRDPIPEDWQKMSSDKIGVFYCGNMAYMAPRANFFPAAMASDGCMDLVTINGDLWPHVALRTLTQVESGKFFDNPHVTYKKVSAYRITPRNQQSGYISIDGEKVDFAPFQAEVHRGLGRVLALDGQLQTDGPPG